MSDNETFLPPPGIMTKEKAEKRRIAEGRKAKPKPANVVRDLGGQLRRPPSQAHLPPETDVEVIPTLDPDRRVSKAELVELILSHVPPEVIAQKLNITEKDAERYIRKATDDVVLRMSDFAEKMMLFNLARLERMYQTWFPLATGTDPTAEEDPHAPPDLPSSSGASDKAAKIVLEVIKTQQTILKDIQTMTKGGSDSESDAQRGENAGIYIEKLELTLTKRSDLYLRGTDLIDEDSLLSMTESPADMYALVSNLDSRPSSIEISTTTDEG